MTDTSKDTAWIDDACDTVDRLSPSRFMGGSMCADTNGAYVTFENYQALLAEIERLRGVAEGLANWADATLSLIDATSCEPDNDREFNEVLLGLQMFVHTTRQALKGVSHD